MKCVHTSDNLFAFLSEFSVLYYIRPAQASSQHQAVALRKRWGVWLGGRKGEGEGGSCSWSYGKGEGGGKSEGEGRSCRAARRSAGALRARAAA